MLVDGDLLGGVIGLCGQIAMIIQECLVLRIEFEALVLEVVSFFEDSFKLQGKGVVDELVLDGGLELFEQFDQFVDLYLVAFHELLLVPHHRPLEALIHALRCLLDRQQKPLDKPLRFLHRIERNHVLL
jgi:hypothetical protein